MKVSTKKNKTILIEETSLQTKRNTMQIYPPQKAMTLVRKLKKGCYSRSALPYLLVL